MLVTLDCGFLGLPGANRDLRITSAGHVLYERRFDAKEAGARVLFRVPRTDVKADGTLRLDLETKPKSPQELQPGSPDARPLGVLLSAIQVEDYPSVPFGKKEPFTQDSMLPIVSCGAGWNAPEHTGTWVASLRRVRYLANICLVLRLRQNLSTTYWLNVNDPGFPFVGVIEHTNFDTPQNYNGSHIVFLSKYLSTDDPIWQDSDSEYFAFAFAHLKRMFPHLDASGIIGYSVWRTPYGQHGD